MVKLVCLIYSHSMSKINQIQNAIKELDGGAFQKLSDSYLKKKGYDRLAPLGSVIGANKVKKGTPDTLVVLPNGKYVFAEYTTQQTGLFEKIQSDLNKCFDEAKTGMPVTKIQEVVFCHTSALDTGELATLRELCEQRGINLSVFEIGSISYDLLEKYPGIARDLLGIDVDSGQILAPDEFVTLYGNNKLATRLDTTFYFREDELQKIEGAIERNDLLIVQGKAGVGKTRLALECCAQFGKRHPEYQVACVFNRGPDLFEDLRVHFSAPGAFLILVDDANRMSKFEYIVQLIQHQREDQRIKVIATVRDYAVEKIREATRPFGSADEISIPPLTDAQIKQMIEKEYGILNHLYLDRIISIAQGNPRIAIMAAEVAKEKDTLESINDVSCLYDRYFASIRQDLDDFESTDLLKAAGIVAFFRVLDRTNEELMNDIDEAFGITPDVLWEAIIRLHELEICDLYENEAARVSDQVLSTYLFYLAFFKAPILDFGKLLSTFFPKQRRRLVDAINPVLDAFDTEVVMDTMRPYVERFWEQLELERDKESFFQLVEVFWFLRQTETLLFARKQIAALPIAQVDLAALDFDTKPESPSHSVLSILSSFRFVDDKSFRMAFNLVCEFFEKCPDQLPKFLHLLQETFCFHHTSWMHEYSVQKAVIDILWQRARQGENWFFAKTFLTIAEKYLHTSFHTYESKSDHAITHISFQLATSKPLVTLRKTIWGGLFKLYIDERYNSNVLKVLKNYSAPGMDVSVKEIVAQDAVEVMPFIDQAMSPLNFQHVLMAQTYFDRLEHFEVPIDLRLRKKFENETYRLYKLLASDLSEMMGDGLSYDEYMQLKKQRIENQFSNYELTDYRDLLARCAEMKASVGAGSNRLHEFHESLLAAFRSLAERNAGLYYDVLKSYLESQTPLEINQVPLVGSLINACGAQKSYSLLTELSYPNKRAWLFSYYYCFPEDGVAPEQLAQLLELYQSSAAHEIPHDWDFILKYCRVKPDIVSTITTILLGRAKQDDSFSPSLHMLFNPYSKINKEISVHFSGKVDLLKQAYFYDAASQMHGDHDGSTFNSILDLDVRFIEEYIDWMFGRKKWLTRYDDNRDYSFIWKRADCLMLMSKAVERVFEHERENFDFSYSEVFFGIQNRNETLKSISPNQESFVKGLIESRHSDEHFMRFVFSLISIFPVNYRVSFISKFLELNRSFEAFANLPLESGGGSWTGSAVPMLQRRIDYYRSIIPLFDTVDFLKHKQHVEQIIKRIRETMEHEKKRDFVSD